MILSESEIRKAVEEGSIGFSPTLDKDQWGQASIDLKLGFIFTVLKDVPGISISVAQGLKGLSNTGIWQKHTLKSRDIMEKPEVLTLHPREFVLAMTYESVKVPLHLIGRH